MTNFYTFYSARYFVPVVTDKANLTSFYRGPVNLNSFSTGEIVSLISPNFSSFRNSINYIVSASSKRTITASFSFTKIIFPNSCIYSGINYDFSWFFAFKDVMQIESFRKPCLPNMACSRFLLLPFFLLKFIFFRPFITAKFLFF